jgi:predicted transcriptional regulator
MAKGERVDTSTKQRGVLVRLDRSTHRRLKHLATDRDSTVLDVARGFIEEGIQRAESEGGKAA